MPTGPSPAVHAESAERDPKPLRIAFATGSPLGTEVDAEIVAATHKAAAELAALGHHVEEAHPEIDGTAMARDFCQVWFAQVAARVDRAHAATGASLDQFELDTVALSAVGRSLGAARYADSYMNWLHYSRKLGELLETYDLYLTPTLAVRPPLTGERTTPTWAESAMRMLLPVGLSRLIPLAGGTVERVVLNNLQRVPFTQLANVTGVPAMSVAGWRRRTATDTARGLQGARRTRLCAPVSH